MSRLDLDALATSAERTDTAYAVVSRSWLKQVLTELRAARRDEQRAGQTFGLPSGTSL